MSVGRPESEIDVSKLEPDKKNRVWLAIRAVTTRSRCESCNLKMLFKKKFFWLFGLHTKIVDLYQILDPVDKWEDF